MKGSGCKRRWSPSEHQIIKKIYPTEGGKKVLEVLHRNGFTDRTYDAVKGYAQSWGIVFLGKDTRFEKGQIPHNKGKKMPQSTYEKVKKSMFKPGNKPHNTKPLYSLRYQKDNSGRRYWLIKVANPRKWKLLHREIYKNLHGEIPKGHVVTFKDGDTNNIHPDNLEMITYWENRKRNSRTHVKDRFK